MNVLTLYYREGCHLCEKMLMDLQPYLQKQEICLNRIDIDEDSEWLEVYNTLVPVLHFNDEPLCKYFLDEQRLKAALTSD